MESRRQVAKHKLACVWNYVPHKRVNWKFCKNTTCIVVNKISLELLIFFFFFFWKKHSLTLEIFYLKLNASKREATVCGRTVRNDWSDRRTTRHYNDKTSWKFRKHRITDWLSDCMNNWLTARLTDVLLDYRLPDCVMDG